jgi:transcriptional regulator with XRE-family HTH domain
MNIGTTIAKLRKSKNLTQQELADRIEIRQTSLSNIESGKKRPNSTTLKLICDELGISELHLYILSFDESDVPKSKRDLFKRLEGPIKSLAFDLLED